MFSERSVKLFRNGKNQVVRSSHESELNVQKVIYAVKESI